MSRASVRSVRWWLVSAAALSLVLGVSLSVAEESQDEESEKTEATAEVEPAPAPELRVEQGRIMTNRGGATQPPAGKAGPVKIDDGTVITNAVLDRLFGATPESTSPAEAGAPGQPAEAPDQPPADPLKALLDEQAAVQHRQRLIADTEAELEAARAKLANLEVELLATRNPFSKRPQLSEEEKEHRKTSGETAAQRNERTQKRVDEARAEVAAVEQKLAQLRSGS